MRSSIRRAKNWSRLHPQGADMLLTAALSILALVSSRAAVDFAEAAGPPGFDLPTLPQEVLGLVLTLGPLAFRRRAPIAAVLTCAGGFVVSRTLLDAQEASVVGVRHFDRHLQRGGVRPSSVAQLGLWCGGGGGARRAVARACDPRPRRPDEHGRR